MSAIKLTQFSHGAGCGCKIAPSVLDSILSTDIHPINYPKLLVGNSSKDDAAVYDMGNGMGLISTTDFFMPIVDDPYQFGRIAAANAISDIYAMGGSGAGLSKSKNSADIKAALGLPFLLEK